MIELLLTPLVCQRKIVGLQSVYLARSWFRAKYLTLITPITHTLL